MTYFGRNEYLKYIIFVLLASSLPPSQLVKLLLSPFLFRQMLGLFLPAHCIPVTLSLRLLTHLLELKEELVGQLLPQSSLRLLLDLYTAVLDGAAAPEEQRVPNHMNLGLGKVRLLSAGEAGTPGAAAPAQWARHRRGGLVLEKGRCPS